MTKPGMRVLIVDDEWPARKRLADLLSREPGVEIVGQCRNGKEALRALSTQDVELMFLDIHMPDLDGFEVLGQLPSDWKGLVVFATAHDHYAVKAFEAHAIDYLLKPFDDVRFHRTMAVVREALLNNELRERHEKLERLKHDLRDERARHAKVDLGSRGRPNLVDLSSIQWIRSASVYVEVATDGAQLLVRRSMDELEGLLPGDQFARIHRGSIVNLDAIQSIAPLGHGDASLQLKTGETFRVSRRYRPQLVRRIGERSS